jgi:hypothetical protein
LLRHPLRNAYALPSLPFCDAGDPLLQGQIWIISQCCTGCSLLPHTHRLPSPGGRVSRLKYQGLPKHYEGQNAPFGHSEVVPRFTLEYHHGRERHIRQTKDRSGSDRPSRARHSPIAFHLQTSAFRTSLRYDKLIISTPAEHYPHLFLPFVASSLFWTFGLLAVLISQLC